MVELRSRHFGALGGQSRPDCVFWPRGGLLLALVVFEGVHGTTGMEWSVQAPTSETENKQARSSPCDVVSREDPRLMDGERL